MTTEHTKQELGTFKKVENIRDIWPTEDGHFTPWLANNMALLNEALELDLTTGDTEEGVGDFRLDILASDSSGHKAVIENQYGRTDHDHLGKLLTYAGGFEANTLIWIAEEFRNEHRAALDLLNNRTNDDTKFFGVRIEALKIGTSLPAPRFVIVVAPNNWAKVTKSGTARDKKYMEFFQPLLNTLKDDSNFRERITAKDKWRAVGFSSPHAGLSYNSRFIAPVGQSHRVELYIGRNDKDDNKKIYDELRAQKESIQSDLGERLNWERLDNNNPSRISVQGYGGIDDEDNYDEIREWMVDHLLKFKEVFGPRLAELADQGILDYR